MVKLKLARVEENQAADSAVIRSVLWLRGTNLEGEAFESFGHFRMWVGKPLGPNGERTGEGASDAGTG